MKIPSIVYDDLKFQKLYEELRSYQITVPDNLMTLGFHEIAGYMLKVQAAKDRVTSMMMEVGPLKSKAEMQAYMAKQELETKFSTLMDLDKEILSLPSDALRKAKVNQKLRDEREYMLATRSIHKLIVAYTKSVENVISNLESKADMLREAANMLKRLHPPPMHQFPGNQQ